MKSLLHQCQPWFICFLWLDLSVSDSQSWLIVHLELDSFRNKFCDCALVVWSLMLNLGLISTKEKPRCWWLESAAERSMSASKCCEEICVLRKRET